jgi:predicted nucleic acid-binding protein
MRWSTDVRATANVTVSDAAYVALAEALDVPLVTADERLAHALGPRCTFDLIP